MWAITSVAHCMLQCATVELTISSAHNSTLTLYDNAITEGELTTFISILCLMLQAASPHQESLFSLGSRLQRET